MAKKILAVTGCPTGIAHTYMAAESLVKAAGEQNIEIKVEKRGAAGIEDGLTEQEIQEAHAIIIAADTDADEKRFAGKPVVKVRVGEALRNAKGLIEQALAAEPSAPSAAKPAGNAGGPKKKELTGVYKHLMNGVSHMLPLVVAGGILIAFSFFWGIEAFKEQGTIAAALMQIGGTTAFALFVPIMAGFISYSIADRVGLAPGLIGGSLAGQLGAGFLGGIIAGFLAGYVTKLLKDYIKLPKNLEGLKPILIIPVLSSLIVGLAMIYVIGTPIKTLLDALTTWLTAMGSANAVILGLILGGMMAFDMGGPLNKVAYTFGIGLLGSGVYAPMAAIMAGGMIPPLGVWLATVLKPKKFTQEERDGGKAAFVLGLSFVTEGAIPYAAADPVRVIPSFVAGSAVAGAISMAAGVGLRAPHGGAFVLAIPNAVSPLLPYVIAIAAGTIVTGVMMSILKKPITE